MAEKTIPEKLQLLAPHWQEHNRNHITEFRRWAEEARKAGLDRAGELLDQAAATMAAVEPVLAELLAAVGGTPTSSAHPHSHHHHHQE